MKLHNQYPHHDLPKSFGEANPHAQFGYGSYTITNHTWGKFSGSINDNTVKEKYTSQQQKNEIFCKELKGDLKSREKIN